MKISEIMTSDPELIDPNASIRDAAKRMKNEDIGALPVGENDRLIGMVTDRDIAMRGVAEDRCRKPRPSAMSCRRRFSIASTTTISRLRPAAWPRTRSGGCRSSIATRG